MEVSRRGLATSMLDLLTRGSYISLSHSVFLSGYALYVRPVWQVMLI
jgi:hypothetical protein